MACTEHSIVNAKVLTHYIFQTKLNSLETFHIASYTICSVITILYAQSIQIFAHYTTKINAKCLSINYVGIMLNALPPYHAQGYAGIVGLCLCR